MKKQTRKIWLCGHEITVIIQDDQPQLNGQDCNGVTYCCERKIIISRKSKDLFATILHELFEYVSWHNGCCMRSYNSDHRKDVYMFSHGEMSDTFVEVAGGFQQIVEWMKI